MFAGNDDLLFADINLSDPDQAIKGPPHNPGSGGWPTIRYFNKETGLDGGNYIQKTSKSICDELGTVEAMSDYVEEYGDVFVCFFSTGDGCDERELKYIEKVQPKSSDEIKSALNRLEGMLDKSMKPNLLAWIKKRQKILKQAVEMKSSGAEL